MEGNLDTRVGWIAGLEEVNLQDPIVVDAEGFTERVLCNLETAIHVPAERRGEVKADGEGQEVCAQGFQQRLALGRARERDQYLPRDQRLVPSSHSREHSSAVDGRVLVIDARGYGQSQGKTAGRDRRWREAHGLEDHGNPNGPGTAQERLEFAHRMRGGAIRPGLGRAGMRTIGSEAKRDRLGSRRGYAA